MFGVGAQELVLILVVALLVFGPKRLPDLARSLGKGMAEFRKASNDLRQNLQDAERLAQSEDTPADAPGPPAKPEADGAAVSPEPEPHDTRSETAETSTPASQEPPESSGG